MKERRPIDSGKARSVYRHLRQGREVVEKKLSGLVQELVMVLLSASLALWMIDQAVHSESKKMFLVVVAFAIAASLLLLNSVSAARGWSRMSVTREGVIAQNGRFYSWREVEEIDRCNYNWLGFTMKTGERFFIHGDCFDRDTVIEVAKEANHQIVIRS
jgi:hypothetical protein